MKFGGTLVVRLLAVLVAATLALFAAAPASNAYPWPYLPPGPPSAPQSVQIGDGGLCVLAMWQPPADIGGGPITSYRLEVTPGGASSTVTNVEQRQGAVCNLQYDTDYQLVIYAINAYGTSPGSEPRPFRFTSPPPVLPPTPEPYEPPLDARDLQATNVQAVAGPGSATVTWTPPREATRVGPISAYYIEASPGGQYVSVPGTMTTGTVEGLTPGTEYTFKVYIAEPYYSISEPSGSVIPLPVPPTITPPEAPTSVTATAGDGSVTVSWEPPPFDGNSVVTGYVIKEYAGTREATVPGSTRTFTFSDLPNGETYRFYVAAINSAGQGTHTWTPSVTPMGQVTVRTLPSFTSTPKVGAAASVTPGTWSPASTYLKYRWFRVSSVGTATEIPYIHDSEYWVSSADAGHRLRVEITGTSGGDFPRTVSITSAPVALGDNPLAPPAFYEPPKVGRTLYTWIGEMDNFSIAYQWQRVSSTGTVTTITGATSASYVPTASDRGQRLRLKVTATRPGYRTVTKTATTATTVAAGTLTTAAPTISGTPKVGRVLTANAGTWKPTPTLRYQWYRVTTTGTVTTIKGATNRTYMPTSADRGRKIRVKVTGSRAGYTSASRTVTTSSTVASGTFVTATPTISGTPKVGRRLTAYAGTWKPTPTLRYQWYRVTTTGKVTTIKGATARTYTPTTLDRGRKMRVKITGSKAGYTTASRTTTTKTTVSR